MSSPLKAIQDIRREEWPFVAPMFLFFFLVITTFWTLKPLKKALFIGYYEETGISLLGQDLAAEQAELVAKVLNMVFAGLAVLVFSLLSRRLKRERLVMAFGGFFIAAFAGFSFLLGSPSDLVVWAFYHLGDLYSTLMVAAFFVFLNDSVTAEQSKRLYGLVVLGGVTGGVFGTTFVRVWIDNFSQATWMWICAGMGALLIGSAMAAASKLPARLEQAEDADDDAPKGGVALALEGAKLVFSSRYLLAIVAIVGLYEVVSTIADFQFTSTIVHFLDGDAIGRQFSTMYMITNIVSMVVQLFGTSLVMRRWGVGAALMVLPMALLLGSSVFLIFPVLWVGSFLVTADNGFAYSINQSAKEALYVPTTRSERYRAKAFIDMFVQRFAKAIGVGVGLGVTLVASEFSTVPMLGIISILVVALWLAAVRYAGREYAKRVS